MVPISGDERLIFRTAVGAYNKKTPMKGIETSVPDFLPVLSNPIINNPVEGDSLPLGCC